MEVFVYERRTGVELGKMEIPSCLDMVGSLASLYSHFLQDLDGLEDIGISHFLSSYADDLHWYARYKSAPMERKSLRKFQDLVSRLYDEWEDSTYQNYVFCIE